MTAFTILLFHDGNFLETSEETFDKNSAHPLDLQVFNWMIM